MGWKSIIPFVILCFAFPMSEPVLAGEDARIRELLKKSGIEAAVTHLPAALRWRGREARRNGPPGNDRFDRAFDEAAGKAYARGAIMDRMAEGFGALLTPADVDALLSHYNSPLGKRITEMEALSATADPSEKLAYVREAMASPAHFYERMALCRKLDEASRTTELGVTVAMHTMIALQSAMAKAGILRGEASAEELKSLMEKSRSTLRRQARQGNMISFLYAYRDLGVDDMRRYLAFLKSPAGKKLVYAFSLVFDAALTERAHVFGEELLKNLNSLPL